jgi:hypothetical protein
MFDYSTRPVYIRAQIRREHFDDLRPTPSEFANATVTR